MKKLFGGGLTIFRNVTTGQAITFTIPKFLIQIARLLHYILVDGKNKLMYNFINTNLFLVIYGETICGIMLYR